MALAVAAADPPPQPASVEVIRDPITDHVRAYATVRARRNRLVVSCDSSDRDRPKVVFHSDRWLARGNLFSGFRPVTHRFDNQRPRRQMWHVEDRHATLTGERRTAAFLAHLAASEKLVIRTRDLERNRIDLTFPLIDVEAALEQAMSACFGREWSVEDLRT